MTKKFLVQIQSADDTRWLASEAQLVHDIAFAVRAVAEVNTTGRIPSVTVLVEESPRPAKLIDLPPASTAADFIGEFMSAPR